jgi:hypothetical protein
MNIKTEDIASAIFIRQSPDFSGLCRFWGLGIGAAFQSRYKTIW